MSKNLKLFARFVREKELDAMTKTYLDLVYQYNIPLLQYFTHLSQEELWAQALDGIVKFLKGFEEDTALEDAKESIRLWEADQLPGISKLAITQLDIFLIGTAQKIAFLSLLPKYAANAETPTQILVELEDYYKDTQQLSLNALQNIQREQQEQLRESEAQYRDLFDNASDLIHMISPEGKIMYVNQAWKDTLGYTDEEAKNLNIYDLVEPLDVDTYRQCRQEVLSKEGQNGSVALTFISRTGRRISVEDSISAKFKDGQPIYSQCIMRDVTQRNNDEARLAEYVKRLEESEEKLRLLFENAPDPVVVVNRKMEITYWNPKAEKVFGWKETEVLGKIFNDVLIPRRHLANYEAPTQQFLATGEWDTMGETSEIVLQDRHKREFYTALTSSQSWQQGEPIYISFIRDIDQQKKVELELSEKRLNLEKANEELEQYAWLASHDLKEPLRKILTFSDMLMTRHGEGMEDRVKEGLAKINSSAYRMHDMIEAVFNYSSLASEIDIIKLVDLEKTVDDVLADLEMQIHEKKATITTSGLPEIEGNPVQLRQLFQNLISNSLKYSLEDISPIINITGDVRNGKLTVLVEDNGIGFDEQYSEKMFQIFKRLVNKEDYKGTGIGLALCRKIVGNHGGTISATSPGGKGAIFKIVLPLYRRG